MAAKKSKGAKSDGLATIGIIGGSGLYAMSGLTQLREIRMKTPFGEPSDAIVLGSLEGKRVAFLARHGRGHRILPGEINYRANICAMKLLGVERIISVSAVGSLKEDLRPGEFLVPDQFFDRTKNRASTFFGEGIVAHVAFGAGQTRGGGFLFGATALGAVVLVTLHLLAAKKENAADLELPPPTATMPLGWVDACAVADIRENRAKVVSCFGERVAIFRYDGKLSAVSSVCQHQNGPLGEGRVIDGCITCPWHGYQYRPETGASPAPFTEKVPTFDVGVRDGRVWLNPHPKPAGTRVEPAKIS